MVMDLEQSKELKSFQVDENIREEREKYALRLDFEKQLHVMRMEEIKAGGEQ